MTIEDRINERLNQRDWDPSPGEQLIGEIVGIHQRDTRYGAYPVLEVRNDSNDEVITVHCLRSGLLWEVVRNRPSIGDRVGIHYLGLSDDGRGHNYVVVFENATETAPDWDRIATEQRERSNDKAAETDSVTPTRPAGMPPW